ncbi:MAG TPA: SRPBCC family protein [Acidimicrobiales bacterium]|nr:SRPBCC family protein [Acidimicrobiales bacterium]
MTALSSGERAQVSLPNDTQILITRHLQAPPDVVYRAYTTPELVSRWWIGQRGQMTLCQIDLRVGGQWRYVMTANGGFEVAFHGTFRELIPDERIVSTEVFEAVPDGEAVSTVTFAPARGGTDLSILVQHTSQFLRDMHINSGMEDGLQEAMDLLDEITASGDL